MQRAHGPFLLRPFEESSFVLRGSAHPPAIHKNISTSFSNVSTQTLCFLSFYLSSQNTEEDRFQKRTLG
jgi:hypothetical protein